MEKFNSLPLDKQNRILDAALMSFGNNGYKKTSVSDIAAAADISKAMVFHYFGTKKALYLFLIDYCGNLLVREVNQKFDPSVTDFFDRIRLSSAIELAVIKKHPALITFLKSVYFERDEEVKEELQAVFNSSKVSEFRTKIAIDGMDSSKFKEDVNPELVLKMLVWLTDGYMNQLSFNPNLDLDTFCEEYFNCMDLLKKNLYKEEFIK